MALKDEAQKDWENGMLYKDISIKHKVSESTVKSWASRYWKKNKAATKRRNNMQPSDEKKLQPKKQSGAQPGNKNAVGNKGGAAPAGAKRALKHGGYSAIYWDTLNEEERELIDSMPQDEETLLNEQVRLYSIRERQIMLAIKKYKEDTTGLAVSGTVTSKGKSVSGDEGNKYTSNSGSSSETKESTYNIVQRLHAELTKVQRAKTSCLDSIVRLHLERERLEILRENESAEGEDMSETDAVIYGEK